MQILTRANRFGRYRLDPSAPLFVLRRIPCGQDADGAPLFLVPGATFDALSVTKMRLATMFRSRFIGHAVPRSLRIQAPAAVEAPAVPPPAMIDVAVPVIVVVDMVAAATEAMQPAPESPPSRPVVQAPPADLGTRRRGQR